MGVPKFYRWISERYPCLSEVVQEFQLPEFDNLYLDMNGVVHVCSHPEDDNPHYRIEEKQIFKDICHYIEFLFRMIKPKKVFFMAIDGVAPRAKMNQQRGRRFRSAREAEELIKKAKENGEVLPTTQRFDSNCITPGTPFMVRLQDHLKYFVVNKVTNDPLWQSTKIILSGHQTPGEGEHKIMDFIRYCRSQPDYNPDTRHCLYGLDADLIMLGLASHEPRFALLREEVRFGGKKDKNKRPTTPEETTFHLLHISLLREYLNHEFSELEKQQATLPFEFDLECVIDDWILMGFLVGNDFIPHLPNLHIHHDALPQLWKTYKKILPTLDGYINEGGCLNLRRFEAYLKALADIEVENFENQLFDMKYLEGKRGGGSASNGARVEAWAPRNRNGPRNHAMQQQQQHGTENSFAVLEGLSNMDNDYDQNGRPNGLMDVIQDVLEADDFDTVQEEFENTKRDYYKTKLALDNTPDVLESMAIKYVRGIQWILLYYYEGVRSWSWYYPEHYAPYISDIKNFADLVPLKEQFDLSQPFRPFEQLMAVLPAASKELLPEPLQILMTSETSPLKEYYPEKFPTDMNGKEQEWEAVVLIPFIDEHHLLDAMRRQEHLLTHEERSRNSHGYCYMYQYTPEHLGTYPSPHPADFCDVVSNHAKVTEIPKFEFCLEPERIFKGLLHEARSRLNYYFPGFPSLRHIPHEARLQNCEVKVFQHVSRRENTMLKITAVPEMSLESTAKELLGQVTWVGWPHLHEAKVYAVADENCRIELVEKKGHAEQLRKEHNQQERDEVFKDFSVIKEKYYGRFGVEIGKMTVLLYAGIQTGQKYRYSSGGRVIAEKQFSTRHVPFTLQTTPKNMKVEKPDDRQFQTMEELFPQGAEVFMLGHPNYGCQGEVLGVDNTEGRVRASFRVPQEPDLSISRNAHAMDYNQYMPSYVASQRVGINQHLLKRITGSVLIKRGDGNSEAKVNIGLNLKFTKRGEEVPGYTRKTDNDWLYSEKCLQVIESYSKEFPDQLRCIEEAPGNYVYTEVDLFPENGDRTLAGLMNFLTDLPCRKMESMKYGADIVGEVAMQAIERAVDAAKDIKKERKVIMQVKPDLLFRPLPNQGILEPDPGMTSEILDRVVVVKKNYSVPFGLRGTIVGIYTKDSPQHTVFDVLFDQIFEGGIQLRCSDKRGYRVPAVAVINLSHGERKRPGHRQPQAQPPKNTWNQQQQMSGFGYQGNQQSRGQGSYTALLRRDGQQHLEGANYNGRMAQQPGQRSGFANKFGSYSQPQYVTPKIATSPPKASKGPAFAGTSMPGADNSDYTMFWNQLTASTATKTSVPTADSATTKKKVLSSSKITIASRVGGSTSLQSAAQKLGKLAGPSSAFFAGDENEDSEPPTSVLVDLTIDEPSSAAEEKLKQGLPLRDSHTAEKELQPVRIISRDGTVKGKVEQSKAEVNQIMTGAQEQRGGEGGRGASVLELFSNAAKARDAQSKSPSSGSDTCLATDKLQAVLNHQAATAAISSGASSAEMDTRQSGKTQQGETPAANTVQQHYIIQQAQQAVSASNESASSTGTSCDLDALFAAALQMAPKTASSLVQPPSEDSSAALKQMLKIGVEDSSASEATNRNNYGKHVTLQELFDGVKQSAPSSKAEPVPPAAQQQQQPVRPPLIHPLRLPPPQLTTPAVQNQARNRSRVDELAMLCQLSNQPLPKYDFNYNSRQKGYISLVTVLGAFRFEGSICPSREEAAESAASKAMLYMQQAQMQLPGQQWRPPMQRPGPGMGAIQPGQRLFSPNSAFSPVSNPLMHFRPALFNQPPPVGLLPAGQQGRQPLLSQPPPLFPTHMGPQSNLQPMVASANRPPYSQSAHLSASNLGQPAHHRPTNQNISPSEAKNPGSQSQITPSSKIGDVDRMKESAAAAPVVKSSTEAFIPMQVTRKQRRKEDTPEKQQHLSSGRSEDLTDSRRQPSQAATSSSASNRQNPQSKSDSAADSVYNTPQSKGVDRDSTGGVPRGGKKLKESPPKDGGERESVAQAVVSGREQGSQGKARNRRSRIAANFNLGSSK